LNLKEENHKLRELADFGKQAKDKVEKLTEENQILKCKMME
jgi:hypothetical protein